MKGSLESQRKGAELDTWMVAAYTLYSPPLFVNQDRPVSSRSYFYHNDELFGAAERGSLCNSHVLTSPFIPFIVNLLGGFVTC